MKRLVTFIMTSLMLLSTILTPAFAADRAPSVSADGVVLMDATTGQILYEKNKNTAYPPASTTKLMTALLTLEKTNLEDVVTVGKEPPFVDGTKIYIFEDEQIKVKDLLYALLLASANDCAAALAEHIGGTVENFAQMMNQRAKELGCKSTNFVNPHGLYNKEHKTSAYDLALIMKELSKHPKYTEIATTPAYLMEPTNKCKEKRPLWNGNKLIHQGSSYHYANCIGGKTGYTIQSKHSFVAAATQNGQTLIVALVHDSKKTFFTDSKALFEYGFKNFELKKLYNKGDEVLKFSIDADNKIPLLAAEDYYYVKKKTEQALPKLDTSVVQLNKETALKKGASVATANITYENTNSSLQLVSGIDYTPKGFSILSPLTKKQNSNDKSYNYLFFMVGIVSIVIFLLLLRIRHVRRKRKLRAMKKKYWDSNAQ